MELLADRDPEEARGVLDPVLQIMMEAVHRFEGTVNQVMGDGIMALFGAPISHEDHAVRACYAALRMQEAARRFSDELRRTRGAEVRIRVGLHSGEVVVRAIGSDLRMDYTAVGQTTHLAARMEQLAVPGSIRMSADTLRLVEGFVQVLPLGEVPVKGLAKPVEVYELTAAGVARRRFEAASARGLTRFVGRQQEMQVLGQALERAKSGHGQLVAPVGEPGVGKSRLFWEFTHSHHSKGWLVLASGSDSYGKASAYLPVIDLLKNYFRIETRDEHRSVREKVIGKLLALDRALEALLPAFLTLLEAPVDDSAWEALDAPQRRQRTLEGIKRLLLRECQLQPVMLIFEDLHWVDSETQAFLDLLVESLPTSRMLLLVNYRPEYRHGWAGKSYYTQLRMDPLPPESAEELLDSLLGTETSLQPVKKLLIDRTEGNPFFLEESVRTLVETRVLSGERGAYRLSAPLQMVQVPATVQAVLAARIDRLPPEEKRLLQAAAVIGDEVRFSLLHAISEEGEQALRQRLSSLQAAEFLYEAQLFPELQYVFKHGLTCQVAYGSLVQERRRHLHARVVEAIEQLYPVRLNEHVELLALHATRGEDWTKSLAYSTQAGTKSLGRSANRDAVSYFEQALHALQQLPQSRENLERAVDVRLSLQASLFPLGELERMLNVLREAEELSKSLDDERRLAWALVYGNFVNAQTGRLPQGRVLGDQALALGRKLADTGILVVGRYYRAQSHLGYDYRQAAALYRENIEILDGELTRQRFGLYGVPAVMSRGWMAWALGEQGRFDEGRAVGEEGMRIAESIDHPFTTCAVEWQGSHLYRLRGDLGITRERLERSMARGQQLQIPLIGPLCAWCLGYLDALSGDAQGGAERIRAAHAAMESMRYLLFRPLILAHLGESCLLAGRPDEALACAREGLGAARERGDRGYAAYALKVLGEVASAQGDFAKGASLLGESLSLAEAMGMLPLAAHVHVGLGSLHKGAGRHPLSQEHMERGTAIYRQLDMPFWAAKAAR